MCIAETAGSTIYIALYPNPGPGIVRVRTGYGSIAIFCGKDRESLNGVPMAPPTSALRALFYVWLPYLCTPRAATAAAHALHPHSRAKTPRAAAAAAHAPPPHPRAKRNVLLIVADDLGYNELGFMNTSRGLHTPHLNFLASQGVALRNYYVQPICSPTRSSLMTGRYPLRIGTQANVIYWDTPWWRNFCRCRHPTPTRNRAHRMRVESLAPPLFP